MEPKDRKVRKRDSGGAPSFVCARAAVYRRLKAIVAFPVFVALAAAAITSALPKRYDASATIQIDPRQRSQSDATNGSPGFGTSQPTIEAELQTVKSEPVIRRVVQKLHLDRDAEFKPFWPRSWFIGLLAAPRTPTESALYDRLSVSRIRNTLLVKIRISSGDPAKSARVANAIAQAYVEDHAEARSSLETAKSILDPKPDTAADNSGSLSPSERVFQTLLAEYKALELPGPRIVAKAEPPQTPAAPNSNRIVAISFLLALGTAVAIALLLEFESSARMRTSRVRSVLSCPHMTSLPVIEGNEIALSQRACRFVLAGPAGDYAEAIRKTCRKLEMRRGGAQSRLILVVSALPGEGAECFASNIAHQYAMAGHAPLLVDADLRSRTLTRQLAENSSCGILDQIASRRPVEKAILRDCATGLHFLPASGQEPISIPVPDVLRSKAFTEAIAALKENFVTIVLAAPPLLSAPDAHLLAELADEIVFATAWQRTPKRLSKKALASLKTHQQKLAGAALTEIREQQDESIMSLYEVLEEMRGVPALSHFDRTAA
jgi:Mrp family chromosome partitioning ATPase/capsular polysaccharide biosynthesis protein